jgi:hypothetical protein
MNIMDEVFADKLMNIHVTGNLVRLDFASMQPHMKGSEALFKKACCIIIPLEAFLNGVGLQEAAVEKLVSLGVVTGKKEKKQLVQLNKSRQEKKIGFYI